MAQQTNHIGDTNKMVTMKIYTEEQVKDMFSGVVNPHHIDVFLEENYTPIELPTNEDIEKEFTIGETTYIDCIKGAKWVIEHIKKQK